MEYLILPISGDIVVDVGVLGIVGVRLKTTASTIPLNTIMITKDTIAIFFACWLVHPTKMDKIFQMTIRGIQGDLLNVENSGKPQGHSVWYYI